MNLNWAAPYGSSSCVGSCSGVLCISPWLSAALLYILLLAWSLCCSIRKTSWAHGKGIPWTERWRRGCLTLRDGDVRAGGCWGIPTDPKQLRPCSEDLSGISASQGHLFNPHFLRHRSRLSESPWHWEHGPGALQWGRLSSAIRLGLTPQQGLLQSHSVHLTARKRRYKTCRCSSIFKLSMGLMCWCQEVPGGRHNSSN